MGPKLIVEGLKFPRHVASDLEMQNLVPATYQFSTGVKSNSLGES